MVDGTLTLGLVSPPFLLANRVVSPRRKRRGTHIYPCCGADRERRVWWRRGSILLRASPVRHRGRRGSGSRSEGGARAPGSFQGVPAHYDDRSYPRRKGGLEGSRRCQRPGSRCERRPPKWGRGTSRKKGRHPESRQDSPRSLREGLATLVHCARIPLMIRRSRESQQAIGISIHNDPRAVILSDETCMRNATWPQR